MLFFLFLYQRLFPPKDIIQRDVMDVLELAKVLVEIRVVSVVIQHVELIALKHAELLVKVEAMVGKQIVYYDRTIQIWMLRL